MTTANSGPKIIKLNAYPLGFGDTPDLLDPSMFATELPVQHSYLNVENDNEGLYVGVWDTSSMIETAAPYPCDEFMVLLEGQAQIKNNKTGHVEQIDAGEAFVIPRGYDCQWHQTGYLRKYFVIWQHPERAMPTLTSAPIHCNTQHIVKFSPGTQNINSYTDPSGQFSAGSLSEQQLNREQARQSHNELIFLQNGEVSLTDDNGQTHLFNANDCFYIPQGIDYKMQATHDSVAFYGQYRQVD